MCFRKMKPEKAEGHPGEKGTRHREMRCCNDGRREMSRETRRSQKPPWGWMLFVCKDWKRDGSEGPGPLSASTIASTNSLGNQDGRPLMSMWLGSQQRLSLSPGKLRGRRHLSVGSRRKGFQPGAQGVSEVIQKCRGPRGCVSGTSFPRTLGEVFDPSRGVNTSLEHWTPKVSRAGFCSRASVWVSSWESCPCHSHHQVSSF